MQKSIQYFENKIMTTLIPNLLLDGTFLKENYVYIYKKIRGYVEIVSIVTKQ